MWRGVPALSANAPVSTLSYFPSKCHEKIGRAKRQHRSKIQFPVAPPSVWRPHEQPWEVSLIFSVHTQWRQASGRCVALSEDHPNAAHSASLQRHYTSDILQKT